MDGVKLKIHDANHRIEELDGQISEKKLELRGFECADEEGKLAESRLAAVANVVDALKKIRQLRYAELHEDSAQQLDEILESDINQRLPSETRRGIPALPDERHWRGGRDRAGSINGRETGAQPGIRRCAGRQGEADRREG